MSFAAAAASPRNRVLAVCAALVIALLAVAALAPLPVSIVVPGLTADVLGKNKGQQVITVTGTTTRKTTGQLRMTTIAATQPDASVHFSDIVKAWFAKDEAAMPRDAVYPTGGTVKEIEKHNQAQMTQSQDAATAAALDHLGLSSSQVKVGLHLADVGGPSAGLMFTLGIIDKIDGNGSGGDLTGGRKIAGTGTITASGKVGAVGGVPLKTQAARRDGATVFIVPQGECSDAQAELPSGLRLVPVTTLDGAIDALLALNGGGGKVPSC
ncbi:MAG: Lon-like protease [Streptomyces sp.]|jgi:PDZ domain-containing protein|nr:Lon-like protease [Streptomyces sp.]MDX6352052.1 Lon-like protease [Streptomyces sp.]